MPPRKEKKSPASAEPAAQLPPIAPGDLTPPATTTDNDIVITIRRELRNMATDLHSKLDKVIKNQESLLSRMQIAEGKQREMEEALSFSTQSIEELQQKSKTFSVGISDIASQLQEAHKKIDHLGEATLNLERYSRSFNLRFGGIPESSSETPSFAYDQVKQILAEQFDMPDAEIENAHRTGKPPKMATDKPRHILAKFLYRPERMLILKRSKVALANSGMFVIQDLPPADAIKKRSLRNVMKKAYDAGKKPIFRSGQLFINGVKYTSPS
jgi:hypothetical protein